MNDIQSGSKYFSLQSYKTISVQVLTKDTLRQFEDEILFHLQNGWFLQGEITFTRNTHSNHTIFSQLLVRYKY